MSGAAASAVVERTALAAGLAMKGTKLLTFEQIKELLELVATHRMTGLELERSGFRLKLEGYPSASTQGTLAPTAVDPPAQAASAPASSPAPVPASPAHFATPVEPSAAASEDELPAGAHVVISPIVGTFYRRPNPDSAPFVDTGSKVEEGDVLCIIEAMKLMNEIESDTAGEIVKIFPKDAQAVEYGERLFAILPS